MNVYVGTYRKYNSGNLGGKWLDLTEYQDHDDFIEACKALHSDEEDPELMYQDIDDSTGILSAFYDESSINPEIWEILEYLEANRHIEPEAVAAFLSWGITEGWCSDTFENAYRGKFYSDVAFVTELLEVLGDLPPDLPGYIHIDMEATARDVMTGYYEESNHYFQNI